MIQFVSLFLGLVISVHPVQVVVSGPVASVEYLLDDESVGVVREEPWLLEIDFGESLAPHELVAVSRDGAGKELARTRQWINLPRSQAEARLALEAGSPTDGSDGSDGSDETGGQDQPARVRLIWESLEHDRPERVSVTFDGEPLQAVADDLFVLPEVDPDQLHVISAELDFGRNVRSRVEAALGGAFGADLTVQMTAVPLRRKRSRSLPKTADLAGRLTKSDRNASPLQVMAIEEGRAEVVVVIEQSAVQGLGGLGLALDRGSSAGLSGSQIELAEGERLRFISPAPRRVAKRDVPVDLFPISTPFDRDDGGIHYLITHINLGAAPERQRIADAVAVAGVQAASGNRPRAVVLILGDEWTDGSRFAVDEVQAFLEQLRVPLVVWSTGHALGRNVSEDRRPPATRTPWGRARDVSSVNRFLDAVGELRSELDSQVIAWVEGSHLPNTIDLTGSAKGLELAR